MPSCAVCPHQVLKALIAASVSLVFTSVVTGIAFDEKTTLPVSGSRWLTFIVKAWGRGGGHGETIPEFRKGRKIKTHPPGYITIPIPFQ